MKIPPFKLITEPLTDEARDLPWVPFADPEVGKRHRIGGDPDEFPESEFPVCECQERMTFYSQIDAISSNIRLMDAALIYTFICFDCYEVKAILR